MNHFTDRSIAELLLIALHLTVALTTASHALLYKRDPRSAWGWIAACWLFPLAGAILYYLFGINRVQQKAQRLRGPPAKRGAGREMGPTQFPVIEGADACELKELVRIGDAMTGLPLSFGNRVTALHNGDAGYPAMLQAIAEARQSVYLCTYIFEAGAVASRFIAALAAAQQRGVQVRVLIDGMSDLFYAGAAWKQLQAEQLPTAIFLPPRWFPPLLHFNLRNHRKLLIVDGQLAFTGGMNIRDAHVLQPPHSDTVADMQFCVSGPVAAQLEDCFRGDWQFAAGEALPASSPAAVAGDSACRAIADGPNDELDKLVLVLLGALASAHRRVWIMTPYFIPGDVLLAALQSAALRGVAVDIVLPVQSDQVYVDWAARKCLEQLLGHQVRVWYQPAPFAHTKLILIDGHYAQVGSANMDARSLRLNFELMLEVYDAAFVATLAQHFQAAFAVSKPLTLAALAARPLPVRLRDAFCWLFSPYL